MTSKNMLAGLDKEEGWTRKPNMNPTGRKEE